MTFTWKHIVGSMVLVIGSLLLTLPDVVDSAVRRVLGSNTDASTPPPPIGCTPSSTFNMIAGTVVTTYSTGGAAIGHSFQVTPGYQNFVGAGFQSVRNTIAADVFIGSVITRTPAVFTARLTVATGNNPIVSNTNHMVPDFVNSRVLLHGTRTVAPCNVVNCLQLQLYGTNDSTPFIVSDVTFSGIDAGQGALGGVSDGTYFYFLQRDGLSANTNIFQFTQDSSLTLVNSASIGNFSPTFMLDDGTNLLALDVAGVRLMIINRTTLGVTFLNLTGFAGNLQDSFGYDPTADVLYVATNLAGVTTIRQVLRSTGAATGVTQSIGTEGLLLQGIQVDVAAAKLYVASDGSGSSTNLRRYNAQTMTAEQAQSSIVGVPSHTASPDFVHKRFWFSGGGSPSFVQPYQLCT